jgi:two-component system, LytTR family, response regulator LytT
MLNILIIEDEEPAANRLQKLILDIDPNVRFSGPIVSVASGVKWFAEHPVPDLVLSDIQLADGLSFALFRQIDVPCPVIFTTAYDEYALSAFKLNSIDYLLKPIKREELADALAKYKRLAQSNTTPRHTDMEKLLSAYSASIKTAFKKRFIVRYGEHIKTIAIEDIVYFYTEDKINFLHTREGRRYTIDYNLDTLEQLLDPATFFRINRQYIIAIYAIEEMFSYSKSRVLIKLNPPARHETIVSAERAAAFKRWLDDAGERE